MFILSQLCKSGQEENIILGTEYTIQTRKKLGNEKFEELIKFIRNEPDLPKEKLNELKEFYFGYITNFNEGPLACIPLRADSEHYIVNESGQTYTRLN